MSRPTLGDVEQILAALAQEGYIADREIATAIYLSVELHKPLLVEGAAGVGKTEIAKVMARALDTDLIRLQCYEGLDVNTALYEWNYQKQMLRIRLEEGSGRTPEEKEQTIFSEPFLLRRPL
ncbi:MAG: AAA family ATPase, partial [Armatimonadota bacterium]|nr:AAA family ATPase [Armatimonadota bacterium]